VFVVCSLATRLQFLEKDGLSRGFSEIDGSAGSTRNFEKKPG
jgi:hypothetical protein